MNQFEINPPKPEFKPMTTADVQQAYGHIPDLCQNLHNFQAFLDTTDPIPEEARTRWILNTLLTEAKFGLTSMTELIDRLIEENQELSQQSQSAQSESKHLRMELDTEKEQNVQLQQTICHLTVSEIQLKTDLLNVYQSKDRRIAELEEEIAQAKRTAQQPSKIVGYERSLQSIWTQPEEQLTGHQQSPATSFPERKPEPDHHHHSQNGFDENGWPTLGQFTSKPNQTVKRLNKTTQDSTEIQEFVQEKSRPVSAQQAPVAPENRTNGQKPIPEPIPMQLDTISRFSTRQPEDIPAEDFIIISEEIERTDLGNRLILTKILNRDYGRVVGRGGQNAERLEQEYNVKISFVNCSQENVKLIISEGNADGRRAASDDIIENLPVLVDCPKLKSYGHALKNATIQCDVKINRPNLNNPGLTICGKLSNCRKAYKMLVNDEAIW
ncbi:hypothetical protein DAPPUDRAFT_324590 [Daphnia pulex]|uniref:K Homology domain-containing protein n=1 Tax=Daphnia pulex TaxID=6669 RepID=E9H263_DAPPU|nr:hypothetical protein DAPPUDRAFT_324590 [Daphnia pulex]|eukprot:EFX74189.1 hypothetical protein DAPPUDRAFT_324590 [Daphnia pulex]